MSSTERPVDDTPAAFPAMWRALRRGFAAEPFLISVSFALQLVAALPDALIALLLALLADGVLQGRPTLVYGAAAGLGACAAGTWILNLVAMRVQRRFRDRV